MRLCGGNKSVLQIQQARLPHFFHPINFLNSKVNTWQILSKYLKNVMNVESIHDHSFIINANFVKL